MHKEINSLQNPSIKKLQRLMEKARLRKKEGLFVIEGTREVNLAIQGGYALREIYFCPKICSMEILDQFKEIPSIEISLEVYQKIAYRGSTEGIIALAETKSLALEELKWNSKNPLILIAESLEKPGNIGALLRSADAAKLDAVIIADPKTDLYNPNIVRSSVGGLFTNQLAVGTTEEIVRYLKSKEINIFTAILQESKSYTKIDFTGSAAIVVGNEALGLSQEWRENSTENIHIPMNGKIDSLNVSVAAGILLFEAKRQRGFE